MFVCFFVRDYFLFTYGTVGYVSLHDKIHYRHIAAAACRAGPMNISILLDRTKRSIKLYGTQRRRYDVDIEKETERMRLYI